MNISDRWKEISALYSEALTYPTSERAAFVNRACGGDETVRQEVESLLACHDAAQDTLDSPAIEVLARDIAADPMPLIGRQLGAYRVEAVLAAGGMGEVYQASDTRLHRRVAIKILPEHLRHDPTLRGRFEREAQAVAALRHPHICVLYDIGCTDGIDFLVMELLEGETIADRLARGPMPFHAVLRHAIQIAEALVAIHRQGMVHRDLKPSNVMLTETGAKLLDFGLARHHDSEHIRSSGAGLEGGSTIASTRAGTPCYMAPEQVRGEDIDRRTDVFAFGALLWEMLTGRKAFDGATPAAAADAVLQRMPAPLSGVPRELESLVCTCLEKDPKRRYQSADEMLRSLRSVGQSRVAKTTSASSYSLVLGAVATAVVFAATLFVPRSPLGDEGIDPRNIAEGGATQSSVPSAAPREGGTTVTANVPLTAGDVTEHSREVQPPIEDPTAERVAATTQPEEVPARVNAGVGDARPERVDSSSGGLFVPTIPPKLPTDGLVVGPPLVADGPASSGSSNWRFDALGAGAGAVWLHLSVLDRMGEPVLGVGRERVTVLEDGVARRITYFTDRQPPLAVSLVVDKSIGTVNEQPAVMEALSKFVDSRGPDDVTQIVNFSDPNLFTYTEFTRNRDRLEGLIRKEPYGQFVALRGALPIALAQHGKLRADQPDELRRAAIIVYTSAEDGRSASYEPEDQMLALARRTDAAIYVLAAGQSSKTRRDLPMLRTLTRDTGGELLFVPSPEAIAPAYRWIANDLASQYVLAFDSPPRSPASTSPHRVEVQISRPDAVARARRVYYPQVTGRPPS